MSEHVERADAEPHEAECDGRRQLVALAGAVALDEGLELAHAELRAHEVAADEERVREALQQARDLLQGLGLLVLGQVGLDGRSERSNVARVMSLTA